MSTQSEGELQRKCVKYAALFPSLLFIRLRVDQRGKKTGNTVPPGTPDFLLCHEHRYVFVELKADDGAPTKAQKKWNSWAVDCGIPHETCRTLGEFKDAVDSLNRYLG